MSFFDNFWNIFWMFFSILAWTAYFIVLFHVVADLFQDSSLSGWWKALWIVCIFILPFLTVLVYLLARGTGMAARQAERAVAARESAESYIRSVSSGPSPTDEIAKARELLDSGTINESEFNFLKERALTNIRSSASTAA